MHQGLGLLAWPRGQLTQQSQNGIIKQKVIPGEKCLRANRDNHRIVPPTENRLGRSVTDPLLVVLLHLELHTVWELCWEIEKCASYHACLQLVVENAGPKVIITQRMNLIQFCENRILYLFLLSKSISPQSCLDLSF